MHQTFVLVRDISELGPRYRLGKPHFEKPKAKLARRSGKQHIGYPYAPCASFENAKKRFRPNCAFGRNF
jgi:hypothetical protein